MLAVADSHGDDGKRSVEARPSEEDQDFDDADDGFCINWDLLKKADLNPLEQEQREAAAEFLFSTFHINGHAITIREQPQLGIAHQVWKASIVLAKYFATEEYFPPQADGSSWWSGKTVLELGAGTGIPGLLLARYGARVTITDLPHVVPQMEWNADHNKPPSPLEPCRAAPLAWGEKSEAVTGTFDVIIGADVVYWERNFAPLIETLKEHSNDDTVIFMSWQKRRKGDTLFFRMLSKTFSYDDVDFSLTPLEGAVPPKALKKMHVLKVTRRKKKDTTALPPSHCNN
ncbi:Protein N-lysine methyltransferase METTL21A [Balamuthia mandrillaris]